jgi:hypothetical protein
LLACCFFGKHWNGGEKKSMGNSRTNSKILRQ